jgi:hypothetical protein
MDAIYTSTIKSKASNVLKAPLVLLSTICDAPSIFTLFFHVYFYFYFLNIMSSRSISFKKIIIIIIKN